MSKLPKPKPFVSFYKIQKCTNIKYLAKEFEKDFSSTAKYSPSLMLDHVFIETWDSVMIPNFNANQINGDNKITPTSLATYFGIDMAVLKDVAGSGIDQFEVMEIQLNSKAYKMLQPNSNIDDLLDGLEDNPASAAALKSIVLPFITPKPEFRMPDGDFSVQILNRISFLADHPVECQFIKVVQLLVAIELFNRLKAHGIEMIDTTFLDRAEAMWNMYYKN